MTVADVNACISLKGNGTKNGYSFVFPIENINDVKVEAVLLDGTKNVLNYGTDYTITTTPGVTGGSVAFTGWNNVSADVTFNINRAEAFDQQYHFLEDERISPTTLELALDKRCRVEQQLRCDIAGINTAVSVIKQIPSAVGSADGQILVTKSNAYVLNPQRVPTAVGVPNGSILAVVNGEWKPEPNTSVGRELPPGGTTGQHLTKKDSTDYNVEWTDQPTLASLGIPSFAGNSGKVLSTDGTTGVWIASGTPLGGSQGQVLTKNSSADRDASWLTPAYVPDPTAHNGDHLVVVGTTPTWQPQRVPDPSAATDGQTLVAQGGQWVIGTGTGGQSDAQQIEDSSGMLAGYTITNNGNSLTTSALSIRFLVGGKRVKVDFPQTAINVPQNNGIYYLVAKSDGSITLETTRPPIDAPDQVTLATANVSGGVFKDVETQGTNLKGLADQIKYIAQIIGGIMFNGILSSDGTASLHIDSVVQGVVDLWKYGINPTDLGQYNFAKWNFTNAVPFIYEDKNGVTTAPQQSIDFNALQYYNSAGNLANVAPNKKTVMLVFIEPNTNNQLVLTYGFGEYASGDPIPSVGELLLSKKDLISADLRFNGICIGAIEAVYGDTFAQSSRIIPYQGFLGSLTGGAGGSAGQKRSFDVSNGLLGTCIVTVLPSKTSVSVTFTGKAVFADDATSALTLITPQNNPQLDLTTISTSDFTYLYLPPAGVVQERSTYVDDPRGDILLAVIDHSDRTSIAHVYEVYTSSNVDAHRIHDIWKSYRPTVRGCVPSLQTDTTDPQNPKVGFNVSHGTFYNYTADPTKQFDNHFKDISAKPIGSPFLFRSIEPKDYADNWVKSDLSTPFTYFPDTAKLIKQDGTATDLQDGNSTFYVMYLNSKGDVIIGVPETAVHSGTVANADTEGFLRSYETKIDINLYRDYARIGVVSAKNDGGVITWDVASDVKELQNKYISTHGGSTRISPVKYGTALVEHRNGIIQEYDPFALTFGEFGDMAGYPGNYVKELSRGYWKTGNDDSASDGTFRRLGMSDLFDSFSSVLQSPPSQNTFASNVPTNQCPFNINPDFANNNTTPIYWESVFDRSKLAETPTAYGEISNNYLFTSKVDFSYKFKLVCDVSTNGNLLFALPFIPFEIVLYTNPNLNPQLDKNDIIISNPPSDPRVVVEKKVFISGNRKAIAVLVRVPSLTPPVDEFDVSVFNGITIEMPVIHVKANDITALNPTQNTPMNKIFYQYAFDNRKLPVGNASNSALSNPNGLTTTFKNTMSVEDLTLPRDHIRLKYGKLADLNVVTPSGDLQKGDRPTNLTAGDIVVWLDIEPKQGSTTYVDNTYWNCDLKHKELMDAVPSISLIDSSGSEKVAELSQVITWHSARYIFRGVTSLQLANDEVIIRIKNTTDITTIKNAMDIKLGACMASDAYK